MRPTKLKLQLAKMFKQDSQARMRRKIKHSIREYNQQGIKSNWAFQSER